MMNTDIIAPILTLIGTIVCSALSVMAGSKLVNYRLEALEKELKEISLSVKKIPLLERRVRRNEIRLERIEQNETQNDSYYYTY